MKELIVELLPEFLSGDRRGQLLWVLALLALTVGTSLAVLAVRRPQLDVLAAAVASGAAAAWLLTNHAAEGFTLVEVAPGNGFTSADLLAAPPATIVLWLAWRRLRQ